jgi:hypothetical protein
MMEIAILAKSCVLRMYEEIEFHERIKSTVLKWIEDNHESYIVIKFDRILKVVHIVPYF